MAISYDELHAAVTGGAVGVRARTVLEPLGGRGDKVFPPTYGPPQGEKVEAMASRYALEQRRDPEGGSVVESVVLDSVASQANRFELALLGAVRRQELALPITCVDFSSWPELGLDRISDLEAPHRVFDALLRDSYDGELLFRLAGAGRAITDATPRNAAAVFCYAPATLLFGGWDSTGPKGGRGAKYERAITSEIIATGIITGSKTSSRLDPAAIEKVGTVYASASDVGWTLDPNEAATDGKGKPAQKGAPSDINHGNIAPTIDTKAGGVTAARIEATTVISFVQLRRIQFPTGTDPQALLAERGVAEASARTALAALGLAAATLAFEEGFDLRSRCVLTATGPLSFELVGRAGEITDFRLTSVEALALVTDAASAAASAGLPWRTDELTLRPSDRLVDLIRRSREHAMASGDGGDA